MKSTSVLLILFIALFSYFWFFQKDKKAPETKDDKVPESVKLTNYDVNTLSEISWKFASVSATLKKDGSVWKLVQPSIDTDSEKTQSFVSDINLVTGGQKYPVKQLSPKDVGLESPDYTLLIKKSDGMTDTLVFGKRTIDESFYYTRKNDQDFIVLVAAATVDGLKKMPDDLRPQAGSPLPSIGQ